MRGGTAAPPPAVPVASPTGGGPTGKTAGGIDMEELCRAVVRSLTEAGVIVPPVAPMGTPVRGSTRGMTGGVQASNTKERRDPVLPQVAPINGTTGQQGKKKKKKKRKKKGRDRTAGADVPLTGPGHSSSKAGEVLSPTVPASGLGGGSAQVGPTLPVETWATVARRGGKKKAEGTQRGGGQAPPPKNTPSPSTGKGKGGKEGATLPRGPRGAAVTITCPEGKYAQVMTEARGAIKLKDLGISEIRTRRAITGALVLEIPGQEGAAKAEALRKRMADLFAGREGVKVSRPVKRSEIRIRDLDDSVTALEIKSAVTEVGGCPVDEVQVGPMRMGPNNMGTVWVRCPLAAARKVVAGGRLTVGWTAARVEALNIRPLQCYKCLKEGHVRAHCTSEVDRSGICYRCGSSEHRAGMCREEVKCPVCKDANLPSNHRLGGRACKGVKAGPKRKGPVVPPSQPTTGNGKGTGTNGEALVTSPREEGGGDPPSREQRERKRRRMEQAVEEPVPMDVGLGGAGASA